MTCKDCIHFEACNFIMTRYADSELNPCGVDCANFKDKSRIVELPHKPLPMLMYNPFDDAYCPYCNINLSGYYGDNNAPDILPCFNCGQWLDNTKYMTEEEAEQALKERETE